MPDQWTTRAEPGMRDRHMCPLCDWYLDTGDPDRSLPADVAAGVKTLNEAVYLVLLEHYKRIDGEIRAHLETHSLEEWLKATADLAYLRGAVAIGGLADVPPPDEGRLFDAMNAGALAVNDVRWVQFASEAIRALTAAMEVAADADGLAIKAPSPPEEEAAYGLEARASRRHADADGYLDGITQIVNTVTGETVTLPEPIRVHLRDIDRVIGEYQERFLAEYVRYGTTRGPHGAWLNGDMPHA